MSAIFDFSSLITVLLLCICTATYLRELRPGIFDAAKEVSVNKNQAVRAGCVLVFQKTGKDELAISFIVRFFKH